MIPVDQTISGKNKGNCFDACLASIMESPIEEFPNYKNNDWLFKYNQFMRYKFGLQLLICSTVYDLFNDDAGGMDTYHIISGPGPRGCHHSVVGLNGKMIHDPHPDRSGLKEAQLWDFIVKSFR